MQRIILAAILAGAAPAVTFAAEPAGRETGVYIRGGGGVAFSGNFDQQLSYNPNVMFVTPPATSKSTELGGGGVYSAAIGFQYSKTRTELEYRRINSSVDAVSYAGGAAPGGAPVSDHFTVQAIMSNVYFDWPNSSALTPYIGLGVGGARVENELGERDAAFAYQGRAGVEFKLGAKLSVGAEYVYFRTLDVVYGPADEAFTPTGPAGPRADGAPFAASSVMGSLRVLF